MAGGAVQGTDEVAGGKGGVDDASVGDGQRQVDPAADRRAAEQRQAVAHGDVADRGHHDVEVGEQVRGSP